MKQFKHGLKNKATIVDGRIKILRRKMKEHIETEKDWENISNAIKSLLDFINNGDKQ